MTASQILEAKRGRWRIENQLHCILDMQFLEDESRTISDNSAENLPKSETSVGGSFSDKQFKCLLDGSFLDKIPRSVFCS